MIHMQLVYLYIKSAIRILVITFVILGLSRIAYALEVDFPAFGGIEPTDSFGPAQWISYIFQFSLAAVGLALIYSFSRAGLEWMFSDSITNKKDAIDRIKNAVLGFVLLLGSYIVLNTINPNLTDIKNPTVEGIIETVGNPNGSGAVGECNSYLECDVVNGEYCVDKETGETIIAPLDDETTKRGVCTSNQPSSSAEDSGSCGGGITCADEFRCLSNTGNVITDPSEAAAPAGTCTQKRTLTEVCSPTGAYNTGCFIGSCVDNICVP